MECRGAALIVQQRSWTLDADDATASDRAITEARRMIAGASDGATITVRVTRPIEVFEPPCIADARGLDRQANQVWLNSIHHEKRSDAQKQRRARERIAASDRQRTDADHPPRLPEARETLRDRLIARKGVTR